MTVKFPDKIHCAYWAGHLVYFKTEDGNSNTIKLPKWVGRAIEEGVKSAYERGKNCVRQELQSILKFKSYP